MINEKGTRELAYLARIDAIEPIVGSDNCEAAVVGGWRIMVRKQTFHAGDVGVYFEIDSKVDITKPEFAFLAKTKGKIKTARYTFGGKGLMYSQGLLMHPSDFGWAITEDGAVVDGAGKIHRVVDETRFLTSTLGVVYIEEEDNIRKGVKVVKPSLNQKIGKKPWARWMMRRKWGRAIMLFFFKDRKKKKPREWPTGRFPGVSRTDQDRVENQPYRLNDTTPYIVSVKCDGSSATYILERKLFGRYEEYVCSRNVRMMSEKQECFYGEHNYYWEAANKYHIFDKMKQWLNAHPDAKWVCWQGEICAPQIQSNPHRLTETHLYCFHWTDSIHGRLDLRDAEKLWKCYDMEVVPIVNTHFILPNDMEVFKQQADGFYPPEVCEGKSDCPREGFVYYNTTNPTDSFKNVSREYLLKHR